jgi:hypothetical protein
VAVPITCWAAYSARSKQCCAQLPLDYLPLNMPLLKRKDPYKIPPVSAPTSMSTSSLNPPSYHSGSYRASPASTYAASRDGDPYSPRYSPSIPSSRTTVPEEEDSYASDRFARNKNIPDAYARGEANLEQDRSELFAGYNPKKGGSGRFFDGPDVKSPANEGEETEEDVEGIKQQTRFIKQESVNSTRNALRMAREAEETARGTLTRLGDQSGRL